MSNFLNKTGTAVKMSETTSNFFNITRVVNMEANENSTDFKIIWNWLLIGFSTFSIIFIKIISYVIQKQTPKNNDKVINDV